MVVTALEKSVRRKGNAGTVKVVSIDRRAFLKVATATATAATAFCARVGVARQDKLGRRPNFVFFLIDDLGWKDLGCFGSAFYETPNIDRLAAQGMRFTNAYAACPVCSPTRASIMTGKYPARLRLTNYIPGDRSGKPGGAVRAGDFRLIESYEDNRIELYNLRADPGEQHDLAAEMPDKAAELRQRLHPWRNEVGAVMPQPNPNWKE